MAIAGTEVRKIKVYEPVAAGNAAQGPLASRPLSLEGKVLGLLNNSKDQVDVFLDQIDQLLHEQVPGIKTVHYRKSHASHPVPFIDDLVNQCDVVINGIGD
jgi:hypothetical protein